MGQCIDLVNGTNVEDRPRSKVAAAFQHLCIEHYTAIHVLIDQDVRSSALALLRPQFEAYVRGVWYYHCASDAALQKLNRGGQPPQLAELIEAVEAVPAYSEGSLARLKDKHGQALNDFTHGGAIQVFSRLENWQITSQHTDANVELALNLSATLAMLAGVGIAEVAGKTFLANEIRAAYDAIYIRAA
jgi:hypothetical protein